jgi:hypothetical protein
MPLERAAGSFYADFAERAGRTAAKVGAITEAESAAWIQSLREVIQGNRFLGGRLHVFVWGTRS